MVKRAGERLHMGITPRSSQGHLKVIIKVNSAKKGENSKFLLFLLQLYRMYLMVETHLGSNTEVHQTHLKRLQG